MMNCKDFCRQLSDYLDGATDEYECRLIEEHLNECKPCEMTYQGLKRTVTVCGRAIPAQAPEAVRRRLRKFLREHCQQTNIE